MNISRISTGMNFGARFSAEAMQQIEDAGIDLDRDAFDNYIKNVKAAIENIKTDDDSSTIDFEASGYWPDGFYRDYVVLVKPVIHVNHNGREKKASLERNFTKRFECEVSHEEDVRPETKCSTILNAIPSIMSSLAYSKCRGAWHNDPFNESTHGYIQELENELKSSIDNDLRTEAAEKREKEEKERQLQQEQERKAREAKQLQEHKNNVWATLF